MSKEEKDLIYNKYTEKLMDSVIFSKIVEFESHRKGFEETTDAIFDYACKTLNEVLEEVSE